MLSNTQGHGLVIPTASIDGIYVGTAGAYGMVVNTAVQDGVYVGAAGSPSSSSASTESNGFEVAGAHGNGLYVGRADSHGVYVNSAGGYGVRVNMAEFDGVNVAGGSWAGWFYGNIYVNGNCVGCRPANFAVNVGERALQPGDVVSVRAVTETDFDTGPALWQVVPAQPGLAAVGVVGVVAGKAELVIADDHRPTETGKRLVAREGAAAPGDYVTIVFSGPMQVKVAPGAGAIAAGARLTAAADGHVRPLRTIKVRLADSASTADLPESAPLLGVALSPAQDDLVWVLVNPQ